MVPVVTGSAGVWHRAWSLIRGNQCPYATVIVLNRIYLLDNSTAVIIAIVFLLVDVVVTR